MSTTNAVIETRERQRTRVRSFLTFFSIVLAIYGSLSYYIFSRLDAAIPPDAWFRAVWVPLYVIVAAAYFVGQFIEHRKSSRFSDVLTWIGAIWFGGFSYFLLGALAIDITRGFDHFFHFLPESWYRPESVTLLGSVICSAIGLTVLAGYLNAQSIRVRPLEITVNKHNPVTQELRIAMISDMHMGTIIGRRMVRQMVERINSTNPDLVLMCGDQMDGNPRPAMDKDLGNILREIRSTHGVFAITGNHEYIGHAETSCAYLEEHGIRMLRDRVAQAAGLYIIGREDRALKQFANAERKPLSELVANLDATRPMILMDHTPFQLEEAEEAGMDLQLSGHTHHAQIWPWGFITKKIYEVSWGYKRKGNTHVYVSCGAGTWGPPIRLGNTPEVMAITMRFTS